MPVITLTQSIINHKLEAPAGKQRVEFCDASLPGLYVLVSAAGNTATFFLRYKDSTKKPVIKVSAAPLTSVWPMRASKP